MIASRELDPAGGDGASVKELVDRYRANGMTNITLKFYPGDRHEILNETNSDEVQQEILDWMDKLVG